MADVDARKVCGMPEKAQLHVAMLTLQFGYAGFHIVSRLALNMGISKVVFPVYRNILALCLLIPFAYFFEKKDRPALTLNFLLQFFLLALVGITANQGFYLLGLDHTSPTFASAIQNSVPAITFAMAAALRIEKVHIDRKDGIAKVVGTLACVAGASVITLFKGPAIFSPTKPSNGSYGVTSAHMISLAAGAGEEAGLQIGKSWTLGCVYLIGHCLSWSGWLVLQKPVLKKYPARLSFTSYTCFFGVIQFLIIAAFIERDRSAWLIRSGSEAFTIVYAGLIASGAAFAIQIWCIDRGGPVFVALYQPVQTLVVAVMASLAFGEEFYLGGILGAIMIIIGLYLVLWGKNAETAYAKSNMLQAASAAVSSINYCEADGPVRPIASAMTQPLLTSRAASEDV